ncbi:MAG TPA: NADH-quinone oxidoreductase subunit C [Blastocatellia bacterium]|jgi:NADH-quinone oxidoreductase subunit C|nr:NADH-quinone oxidoreductase subunit C [Blastocatellia bacterium]
MADEIKDTPEGPEDKPEQTSREGVRPSTDPSAAEPLKTGEVGADVPEKAQPLPPEAGTVDPAAEAEARAKPELAPGDEVKTEAKVENALPGVEKPSKTPSVEGASDAGAEPPAATPPPRPAPPRAPATEKAAPPKAAPAAGHKPPPPAKKGPSITADITGDPFIDKIKQRFGGAVTETVATLGQQIIRVQKASYVELCRFLHDDEEASFDMCTDLTAIHWPERAGEEFDVVVLLYSVSKNRRLRVKTAVADAETCPSVAHIWTGADWMEREVYDMFGIRFDGHPDLRRILLPSDWPGHPLRKEYPIEYRDNEWTDKHIEYREIDYDTSLIDVKYAERR